jgi:integration host factor subunit beta
MKKKDIVEYLSKTYSLPFQTANKIVTTFFECIIDALKKGDEVQLRGFGSLRLRQRKERIGRNPKTGDKVKVPPKKVVYFKQGKDLYNQLKRTH